MRWALQERLKNAFAIFQSVDLNIIISYLVFVMEFFMHIVVKLIDILDSSSIDFQALKTVEIIEEMFILLSPTSSKLPFSLFSTIVSLPSGRFAGKLSLLVSLRGDLFSFSMV